MASKSRHHSISIVLIGTKGSGKSSTGNSILKENKFNVFIGTKNGTEFIQKERTVCLDTDVLVFDTPGVNDVNSFKTSMNKLNPPTNAIYAIVIAIGRYTASDKYILQELKNEHRHILDRSIIIFTRRKELDSYDNVKDRTIDHWLESVGTLSEFITQNKLKTCVFENVEADSSSKARQVKTFIELCKEIEVNFEFPAPQEHKKRTITVDFDAMQNHFGNTGVDFFEARYKLLN